MRPGGRIQSSTIVRLPRGRAINVSNRSAPTERARMTPSPQNTLWGRADDFAVAVFVVVSGGVVVVVSRGCVVLGGRVVVVVSRGSVVVGVRWWPWRGASRSPHPILTCRCAPWPSSHSRRTWGFCECRCRTRNLSAWSKSPSVSMQPATGSGCPGQPDRYDRPRSRFRPRRESELREPVRGLGRERIPRSRRGVGDLLSVRRRREHHRSEHQPTDEDGGHEEQGRPAVRHGCRSSNRHR